MSKQPATLTQEALGEVQSLARILVDYDNDIEAAEEKLKALKENARRVREESLPNAMAEVGLDKVVLQSGEEIKVKRDVYVAIPSEQKPKAYAWLEANGHGALIKTEVAVAFGKEQREAALEFQRDCEQRGLEAEVAVTVHAGTLKAFLREQLENAKPVPLDLFGARPVSIATVKLPKKD